MQRQMSMLFIDFSGPSVRDGFISASRTAGKLISVAGERASTKEGIVQIENKRDWHHGNRHDQHDFMQKWKWSQVA